MTKCYKYKPILGRKKIMSKRVFGKIDMGFFKCKGCKNTYRAYFGTESGTDVPVMRDHPLACPQCSNEITVLNEIGRPKDFDKLIDKRPNDAAKLFPVLSQ
jgi:hypothetical protein